MNNRPDGSSGRSETPALADGGTTPDESDEDGGSESGVESEEREPEELEQAREKLDERAANVGFDSSSGDWLEEDDDDLERSSVSRRGAIGYLGGTTFGVLGLASAGWYVFLRETRGPEEQVVVDYWDYIDRAHYNSAVALFHRNAPVDPPTPRTVAVYSQANIDVESTEVLDEREETDLAGVGAAAIVRADITLDWGSSSEGMEPAFVVAENDDGDWRMWDDGRESGDQY